VPRFAGDILLSRQASGLPRFSQAALARARARCAGPFVVPPHSKAGSEPLRAASPVLAPRRLGRWRFLERPPVGLLASGRDPRGSALSPHRQPLVGSVVGKAL